MPKKKSVSVTKQYTLETFMKNATTLKISKNVIDDFIQELDDLVTKITKQSERFAKEEGRKTIMPIDLEKSIDDILRRGTLTVDELFQKIELLPIIEISKLSKQIKKKADELLKPRSKRKRK